MQRIVIFGNSGAGKTTLANEYAAASGLRHLDLDILAWQPVTPPERRATDDSAVDINAFINKYDDWVIEGCYADLLALVVDKATKLIFLNPGIKACSENCKKRPWEPHKYASLEEQNKNLNMLLDWVKDYETRIDEFSLKAHQQLYDAFSGEKELHD